MAPRTGQKAPVLVTVESEDRTATVEKVRTNKGYRMEIRNPETGRSIRLDALEAETLTWQSDVDIGQNEHYESADAPSIQMDEESFTLINEFAEVEVGINNEDGWSSLIVKSPKLGYIASLSAEDLHWITRQDTETFSSFLETPFPDH